MLCQHDIIFIIISVIAHEWNYLPCLGGIQIEYSLVSVVVMLENGNVGNYFGNKCDRFWVTLLEFSAASQAKLHRRSKCTCFFKHASMNYNSINWFMICHQNKGWLITDLVTSTFDRSWSNGTDPNQQQSADKIRDSVWRVNQHNTLVSFDTSPCNLLWVNTYRTKMGKLCTLI